MSWRAQGLKPWILQRVTAVYIALYLLVLTLNLGSIPVSGYEAWHGWMTSTWVSLTTALFILCLLFHAWVGIRDVAMDYIKPWLLRFFLMTVFGLSLVFMAIWATRMLFA